jgi:hypothetical protein
VRRVYPLALLIPLLVAGVAAAQQPVQGCTRECRPQDVDVNGPFTAREPPVRVILYANERWDGRGLVLTTHAPEHEPDRSATTLTGAQSEHVILTAGIQQDLTWPSAAAGLARDAEIVGRPVAFVYLSADLLPVAGLRLVSTVLQGQEVLARGEVSDLLLSVAPEGNPVYEVRIEMPLQQATWRAGPNAPVWVVAAITPTPTPPIRVHTGPTFLPRLLADVANPLAFDRLTVQDAVISARLTSPFGPHDVHPDVTLRIETPDGRPPVPHKRLVLAPRTDDNGTRALHVSWRIQWRHDDRVDVYPTTATARTWQNTFETSTHLDLAYEGPPVQMPGPASLAALAAAVVGGLLVGRTRRRS